MIARRLVLSLLLLTASVTPSRAQQADTSADTSYVIQPSDVISLKYRYTPEFDFTGAVLPDGMIVAPVVGPVKLAGLTVVQAHELLLSKASERLREPELTLDLKDFQKPYFVVGGEVSAPGKFDLRGRVSILEAVAIAGGFKTSAQRSKVVLYRRYDETTAIAREIQTKDLLRRTEVSGLALESGDFIVIPQSTYSKVEKFLPLASMVLFNPWVWR